MTNKELLSEVKRLQLVEIRAKSFLCQLDRDGVLLLGKSHDFASDLIASIDYDKEQSA